MEPSLGTVHSPPDTRERILLAACEVIAQRSFRGAGLASILQAAGVPKGSFYHHFRSKDDLGVAVVERAAEQCAESARPILADRYRPALVRLRALFAAYREQCRAGGWMRGCLISKMALEAGDLNEAVREAVRRAYDQWAACLAGLLREAQEEGAVGPGHVPEQLAHLLVSLWEGTVIRARAERSLAPIDAAITFFFDSGFLRPRT